MVKLILFVMMLSTGQLDELELKQPFDTVEMCEAAKPEERAKFMAYLKAMHQFTAHDVIVGLECTDQLLQKPDDRGA